MKIEIFLISSSFDFLNVSYLVIVLLISIYTIWDNFYSITFFLWFNTQSFFFISDFVFILVIFFLALLIFLVLCFFTLNYILQHWIDLHLSFLINSILKFHGFQIEKSAQLKDVC